MSNKLKTDNIKRYMDLVSALAQTDENKKRKGIRAFDGTLDDRFEISGKQNRSLPVPAGCLIEIKAVGDLLFQLFFGRGVLKNFLEQQERLLQLIGRADDRAHRLAVIPRNAAVEQKALFNSRQQGIPRKVIRKQGDFIRCQELHGRGIGLEDLRIRGPQLPGR